MAENHRKSLIFLIAVLVAAICCFALNKIFPDSLSRETELAAQEFGVDEALLRGMIFAESRYDVNAVSHAGAYGPMQLMPSTREMMSERTGIPADGSAESEIRLGAAYISYLLDRFGDVRVALAAYNAGPSNAERWLRDGWDPYPETAQYIKRVLFASRVYARALGF